MQTVAIKTSLQPNNLVPLHNHFSIRQVRNVQLLYLTQTSGIHDHISTHRYTDKNTEKDKVIDPAGGIYRVVQMDKQTEREREGDYRRHTKATEWWSWSHVL